MAVAVVDGRVLVVRRVELSSQVAGSPAAVATVPPGTRYVLSKLLVYNRDTTDHDVILGSGGVELLRVRVPAGSMLVLGESETPRLVFTGDVQAWLDAAVTSNPVIVVVELVQV